jgi:hypothetical protein
MNHAPVVAEILSFLVQGWTKMNQSMGIAVRIDRQQQLIGRKVCFTENALVP